MELVCEAEDGSLTAFFDNVSDSPLLHAPALRQSLREGALSQSAPYLQKDAYDCYYACLRAEGGFLMMGPMAHQRLTSARRREMFRDYGLAEEGLTVPPVFTLSEIRNMILLANTVPENASLENEELLQLNRIISQDERQTRREQTRRLLKEEEENDDDAYRHGYREEQLLMQAVREGRVSDAVRLAESMDRDIF